MSFLSRVRAPGGVLLGATLLCMTATLTSCTGAARDGAQAYDSDMAIADRVHQAMSVDPATAEALQNGRIRIRVLHGSVTLLGNVDSARQMSDALAAVRAVGGVQAVQSDLHLRPISASRSNALSISESAKTDSPKPSRSE
ncbi:BON domain-containing protein [Robbsia andropogonis]|uniref:BON domain-containing protein n=1 Tax=Robbsia andropogonis TaxID=28092 RepID=UPI000463B9E1|nr:BON domain-containing protein [Robbsia andropogonis]MCP1120621.1 BON domain-containing protein [Robbsia andropogonis]MCP1128794.1 BON domain-containing protein [Robbsia andropogonis]